MMLALKRQNQLNASPLVPNGVRRVQIGSQNLSKINPNSKSKMECLLASIFNGLWWILGSKLGGKMEPRSIQKGIEKTMKKWKAPRWPKGRSKERRRTLRRCGAGSARGRRGVDAAKNLSRGAPGPPQFAKKESI